jgi:hypothetical protein
MAEVRAETEFGLRYMELYYINHKLLEGILGEDYMEELDQPLVPSRKKSSHDKAN